MPSLFATIAAKRKPIAVLTSGVTRATDSANAFTGGLSSGDPALAALIQAPVTNKDLLYFHKQPQNATYQAYVDSDPELLAVLARIDGLPQTSSSLFAQASSAASGASSYGAVLRFTRVTGGIWCACSTTRRRRRSRRGAGRSRRAATSTT
ncbi:hypothetical protein [Paractinoplanes globisporus]|uniref:Uncharacterized protein n=1 Tax=Paractinoplanes globisporus TaxID=113565 RepID=A0ABW6WJS9_9ACTN|nr:hypothetical protein [Actinoplanes globisporus]